jgi:hypothetical protein
MTMTGSRLCLAALAAAAAWAFVPAAPAMCAESAPPVLKYDILQGYVDTFNRHDNELYSNAFPNAKAMEFLKGNVPLFDCPDEDIRRTYYFRWWTYRKHVKQTPDGYVVTEFLPQVPWSGKHNAINCPAGHHFYEGRWIHDAKYLSDYAVFWFRKGGSVRAYSFWAADAIYAMYLVQMNKALTTDLLDDLVKNYKGWEQSRLVSDGLFWQIDDRDGMEVSVGNSGKRATINSYMYGDARAIARIAELAGRADVAKEYQAKADRLRDLVQRKLWDPQAKFFKTLPYNPKAPNDGLGQGKGAALVDVRELHGFTPWYFNLPQPNKGYEVAWKQLMDPNGFYAPYGPTTAERRHPGFRLSYEGHACQWNGPSWPLSTAVTLTAMANVLNNYPQDAITKADYLDMLRIYAHSQQRKLDDGTVVPWIDENINPLTGDWLCRTMLLAEEKRRKEEGKPAGLVERGKDYNHSSFCDLVITGLVGLRPRGDDTVEVSPLVPEGKWDFFCLDDVLYHGKVLTIIWDKTGAKYGRGAGLCVLVNGKQVARGPKLGKLTGKL